MSSVVDFLERMGSEAHWSDASQDEIALALAEAKIEAPMCTAILTKNAADVRALLGQKPLITELTPGPAPETPQPEPGKEDEDGEEGDEDETAGRGKPSNSACDSPSISLRTSL